MELTIDQTLQQGVGAHKEGNLQEAERLYRAILQTQPAHPDANHNLGVLAVSVNKAESALPLFKTALEANPNIEQFWLSYIDALIKEKQLETAKAVLEQGKKTGLAGKKVDALEEQLNANSVSPSQQQLSRLLEHYQNGQHDEAEKLAVSITKQFPTHQFGWKVLGLVFGQTGRKSEAVNANQRAVQLAPQDAAAHSNLGVTLQKLGRLEEAEASCRQSIALKSDYAEAHYNLGITLKALGRLEEAEASYRQAIAFKSDFAKAHYNLGNMLKALGRLEEAEASYRQAIALKSDYAAAHSNLGNALQALGRLEEAEASCRQSIALKPDYAEAHNNLGNTLKELGRLEEAEASYRQAIALKSDFAEAHGNLGITLQKLGQLDLALASYEKAVEIKKDLARAKAGILETLYALGRIEEIYQRIEMQSEVDDENIRIAAFASFLAKIEKKDTANNFCKNPIDFIHVTNISSHLEDSTAFITEIIEELHDVKTIWEPTTKATHKGFQTPNNINLFANPPVKIAHLKSIIIDELDSYYLKFRNESCSYIQKWPSEKNLFGWHVILKHQGHQSAHIHSDGWLSGVIYLKVVPSLGKDEGAIEFSLNGANYSNVNSPKLTYQPEVGDIVFFPSSLHHRTIPFTTDTDRIIVSFDLMPEAARH